MLLVFRLFILILLSVYSFSVHAQSIAELNQQQMVNEQRLFQQQQDKQQQQSSQDLAEQVKTLETKKLDKTSDKHQLQLPKEQPCFPIQQVKLNINAEYEDKFTFLQKTLNRPDTGIINQCIGADGLQQVLKFAQDLLLEKGYVTSRVMVKPQDLNTGQLVLSVIVGKVAHIYREQGDENVNFRNALTIKQGDIVNLRELEQSVDNLKLPSHVQAKILIEPMKNMDFLIDEDVGLTDLVVKRQKSNKLSMQAMFNNYGNQSTGIYQAGLGLTINEPLLSNDKLYIQYMGSLDGINHTTRPATNENIYLNYQYPLKSWRFGLSYNRSRYTQALKGWNSDPIYKGISQRKQLQVSKSLHRTANAKLSAYGQISQKQSDYFVDDLEILVQKRRTTNYALGLDYELIRANGHQLNVDVSMNKGSGMFKSLPVPERFYSDVDSRPLIWLFDGRYHLPFQVGKQQFGYNLRLNTQYSHDNLSPNEQFTVGDRYMVRGFDGKRLLSGNKGLVIGQEVYYKLPTQNPHQLYFALDKGWVSGDGLTPSKYNDIMGSVLGYRFGMKHLNFDAYIGQPIQSKYLSNKTNAGVQIAIVY